MPSKKSKKPFSFQVANTVLTQTLPGGPYQTNPYQIAGPRNAFEAKTVEEGFYVRVDMPGVGKDSVEVKFENKKLSFRGKAPQESPFESGPRYYKGEIKFSSESVEVSGLKVDTNNGVLRMVLVGSGFPPDYYASSSHVSGQGHEQTSMPLTCDVMWYLQRFSISGCSPLPGVAKGMYPFQLDGAKGTYEMAVISDDQCFVRIDMPDVDVEGLSVRFNVRKMFYGGTGVKTSQYDESKRLYFKELEMNCPCDCKLVDIDGEITDGVARMFVTKERVKPLPCSRSLLRDLERR